MSCYLAQPAWKSRSGKDNVDVIDLQLLCPIYFKDDDGDYHYCDGDYHYCDGDGDGDGDDGDGDDDDDDDDADDP